MDDAEAQAMVDRAAEALGEHFEAVFVVVSRGNPDEPKLTQMIQRGRGNWFAQRGMLREVLDKDAARLQAYTQKQVDSEPDEL